MHDTNVSVSSVLMSMAYLCVVFVAAANRGNATGSSQTGDALGKALASVRSFSVQPDLLIHALTISENRDFLPSIFYRPRNGRKHCVIILTTEWYTVSGIVNIPHVVQLAFEIFVL